MTRRDWTLFDQLWQPVLIAFWAFLIIATLAFLSVGLIVRWLLISMLDKAVDWWNVKPPTSSGKG